MLSLAAPAVPPALRPRAPPARRGTAPRLFVVSKAAKGAASAPKKKPNASHVAASAAITAVVQPLNDRILSLRQRVKALEQKLRSLDASRLTSADKPAEAEAGRVNRGNQLNPSCREFWKSRGYVTMPWKYKEFAGSDLAKNHFWPEIVERLKELHPGKDEGKRRAIAHACGVTTVAGYNLLAILHQDEDVFSRSI